MPERDEERTYVVSGEEERRSGRRSRLCWNAGERTGRRNWNLLFLWFLKRIFRK